MQYEYSMKRQKRTLDIIAPLEKKLKRKNKPWHTNQLLGQLKIVRNRERTYMNYRQNHYRKAFTREHNRYNGMLDQVTKMNKANKDSKQLFRSLNSLLEHKIENPLPTGTTDSQLAEDFKDFFLNKIDKTRKPVALWHS